MAYERKPGDPDLTRDPYRSTPADDDIRRSAEFDNELQADPELAEGPANGSRMALFAVGIALVLGAVFYGLNNSSIHQAGDAAPIGADQPVAAAGASGHA